MYIALLLTLLMAVVTGLLGITNLDSIVLSNYPRAPMVQTGPSALQVQTLISQTPILMYHYVEYVQDSRDTIRKSLDITPGTFEAQIKTFLTNGYTFITMSDLGAGIEGKYTLPQKPVILTFDDGYKDFYTDVFPILKKFHVPATAYIVSHFLGKPNYMSADNVKEIAQSALVDIGAHTEDHIDLRRKSLPILQKEIAQSKKDLEDLTKQVIHSFAYPYGVFDAQARTVVSESGYGTAVSTSVEQPRRFDQWTIDRIRPGALTGESLIRHIENILRNRNRVFSAS